jgi:hypothetical protein
VENGLNRFDQPVDEPAGKQIVGVNLTSV